MHWGRRKSMQAIGAKAQGAEVTGILCYFPVFQGIDVSHFAVPRRGRNTVPALREEQDVLKLCAM
jgi:hypothetical protein